jgi:hypothetical protein
VHGRRGTFNIINNRAAASSFSSVPGGDGIILMSIMLAPYGNEAFSAVVGVRWKLFGDGQIPARCAGDSDESTAPCLVCNSSTRIGVGRASRIWSKDGYSIGMYRCPTVACSIARETEQTAVEATNGVSRCVCERETKPLKLVITTNRLGRGRDDGRRTAQGRYVEDDGHGASASIG